MCIMTHKLSDIKVVKKMGSKRRKLKAFDIKHNDISSDKIKFYFCAVLIRKALVAFKESALHVCAVFFLFP